MNEYNYLFKFILVGDINVGKSSLLLKFTENRVKDNYEPTIGVEFGSKLIEIYEQKIKLQIWDTAGQESYRSIIRSYYRGCVGVMLVFDLTSKSSFQSIKDWLDEIRDQARSEVVVTIIGNKCDVGRKEVREEEIEALSKELNLQYFETSALEGDNVYESFEWLARNILDKISNKEIDPKNKEYGIRIGGQMMIDFNDNRFMTSPLISKSKKKGNCCC